MAQEYGDIATEDIQINADIIFHNNQLVLVKDGVWPKNVAGVLYSEATRLLSIVFIRPEHIYEMDVPMGDDFHLLLMRADKIGLAHIKVPEAPVSLNPENEKLPEPEIGVLGLVKLRVV